MVQAILASAAGSLISGALDKITGSSDTAGGSSKVLGKDDFLRLLTTQLQYQDPMDPMSNTEFVAQMAQFSSLEQLQNMNSAITQLATQLSGNGLASAAPLLGQQVTLNGSSLTLPGTGSVSLTYALPASAASVAIQVLDGTGTTVRTLAAGAQTGGSHTIGFDGLDDTGQRLAAGTYTYRVQALDAHGETISGAVTGGGRVTGINMEGGQPVLAIGNQRVPLSFVVGLTAGTTQ